MKKGMLNLAVPIPIAIIGGLVILEFISSFVLDRANVATQEEACKVMNMLSGKTDLSVPKKASIKGCTTIDLGIIPSDKYNQDKEGIMKNLADKIAKTWNIWKITKIKNIFILCPSNLRID